MSRTTTEAVLVLMLMAAALGGCGGSNVDAAAAAAPAPPSEEVGALRILFVPAGGDQTVQAANTAVQNGLVAAGYKVVIDKRAPSDVTVTPKLTATQEQSLFQVTVNGQQRINLRVHLTLAVTAGSEILDQFSTEFVTPAGQVKESDVSKAISGLAASARVSQFARDRKKDQVNRERAAQEAADASKKHAEDQAKGQARVQEESDWNAAKVQGCRMPASLSGCDAVRLYIAKYENGTHVEEAKKALQEGEPAMVPLQKDENDWKTAGSDACKSQGTTDACAGVEIYATKHSAGLHADEARRLIRK